MNMEAIKLALRNTAFKMAVVGGFLYCVQALTTIGKGLYEGTKEGVKRAKANAKADAKAAAKGKKGKRKYRKSAKSQAPTATARRSWANRKKADAPAT